AAKLARSVAELAEVVLPPAVDLPALRDGAGVIPADRELRHAANPGLFGRGSDAAAARAGAELAPVVAAPAEHAPARDERARVHPAGADRDRAAHLAHRRRGGVVAA